MSQYVVFSFCLFFASVTVCSLFFFSRSRRPLPDVERAPLLVPDLHTNGSPAPSLYSRAPSPSPAPSPDRSLCSSPAASITTFEDPTPFSPSLPTGTERRSPLSHPQPLPQLPQLPTPGQLWPSDRTVPRMRPPMLALPSRPSVSHHVLRAGLRLVFCDVEYNSEATGPAHGEIISTFADFEQAPRVFPCISATGEAQANCDFIEYAQYLRARGFKLALWNPANDFRTLAAHGCSWDDIFWLDRSQLGSNNPNVSGPSFSSVARGHMVPYLSRSATGEVCAMRYMASKFVFA